MNTKMMVGLLVLFALAMPADATPLNGGGQCNNNGVVFQAGIGNQYECNSIVQYCHQGTGAGAGAGAGGPGQNEAGAEASAGTQCTASNGDDCGEDDDPCDKCDEGGGGAALDDTRTPYTAFGDGGDDCEDSTGGKDLFDGPSVDVPDPKSVIVGRP